MVNGNARETLYYVNIMCECIRKYRNDPSDNENIKLYSDTQKLLKQSYETPPTPGLLYEDEIEQVEYLINRPIQL